MRDALGLTTKVTELTAQLRALGVRDGGVLLVHTAFTAVRPVEGGPSGSSARCARHSESAEPWSCRP